MTTSAVSAKLTGSRFVRFFSGILSELRKVVWLTRREVAYLTFMVLIVAVAAGIVLGLFDFGFSAAVDKFIITK
jgi:preprotein translocase subunit SecE